MARISSAATCCALAGRRGSCSRLRIVVDGGRNALYRDRHRRHRRRLLSLWRRPGAAAVEEAARHAGDSRSDRRLGRQCEAARHRRMPRSASRPSIRPIDGFKGEGAYKDVGPQKIATLAVLYPSVLHVVASKSSGIKTVADIKGKRASVGSAGSSTESIADRVLAAGRPRSDGGRDARQSRRCRIGRRAQGRQGRCVLLDRRRADGGGQGSRLDQCH